MTTLRFFGDPAEWDAPATDGQPFETPPTDTACCYCLGAVRATDTGVMLPHLAADGSVGTSAYHRDCFLLDTCGFKYGERPGLSGSSS